MLTVGVYIHYVVVAIYRRCHKTESYKCYGSKPKRMGVEELTTKEHGDEHEEIFYPLLGASEPQNVLYHIVFTFSA